MTLSISPPVTNQAIIISIIQQSLISRLLVPFTIWMQKRTPHIPLQSSSHSVNTDVSIPYLKHLWECVIMSDLWHSCITVRKLPHWDVTEHNTFLLQGCLLKTWCTLRDFYFMHPLLYSYKILQVFVPSHNVSVWWYKKNLISPSEMFQTKFGDNVG
jgi:hypothetical protein